ncbi:MAG TPA: mannose-1-phosphate guanylyltransferase/mannose-6-phosphate isomerase [Alphaproteobacteria bacterium]|nr:mannose-1-phosphate guanylyltransferase/mannose-6-phosphate isomerase [Alphaproteobacteria bacterium]
MARVFAVILAGGSGTRLWPLSREDFPKQFLDLTGCGSLLQQTVRRAMLVAQPSDIMVVAAKEHQHLVKSDLDALHPELAGGIILEPSGRNTAAAVALAAELTEQRDGDAVMWVMPADHAVEKEPALLEAINAALPAAEAGRIVTFGIKPTRPETGFGYIKQAAPLEGVAGVHQVAQFIEKPDLEVAERMVATRQYLWNSGMLLVRARTFLDELATHSPEIALGVAEALATRAPGSPVCPAAKRYSQIPSEPFDRAVLERSSEVAVVPCDLGWSDVGTFNNMWQLAPHDMNNNVISGAVITDRTNGCIIQSKSRLVATTGVKNLAIVETPDAILIADRADSEGVRRLIKTLKAEERQEVSSSAKSRRPWGTFQVLHEAPGFKVKEIVVNPGGKLSLQLHHHRHEHWVVVKGVAHVTRGDAIIELHENQSVFIPVETAHRMENRGDEPLHIIEVQYGSYTGEDDIVRLEDTYGRAPEQPAAEAPAAQAELVAPAE